MSFKKVKLRKLLQSPYCVLCFALGIRVSKYGKMSSLLLRGRVVVTREVTRKEGIKKKKSLKPLPISSVIL